MAIGLVRDLGLVQMSCSSYGIFIVFFLLLSLLDVYCQYFLPSVCMHTYSRFVMFQNLWPQLRPTVITEKKLLRFKRTFMFWVVNQQHNKTGPVSLREVFLGDRQENCTLPVLVVHRDPNRQTTHLHANLYYKLLLWTTWQVIKQFYVCWCDWLNP